MNDKKSLLFERNDVINKIAEYIISKVYEEEEIMKDLIFITDKKGFVEVADFKKLEDMMHFCNEVVTDKKGVLLEIEEVLSVDRQYDEKSGKTDEETIVEINIKKLKWDISRIEDKRVTNAITKIYIENPTSTNVAQWEKIVLDRVSKWNWVKKSISNFKYRNIHKSAKYEYDHLKRENKEEYKRYLDIEGTSKYHDQLKWKGDASQLSFIISALIEMDYIEIPKMGGKDNLRRVAQILHKTFETGVKLDTFISNFDKSKQDRTSKNFKESVEDILKSGYNKINKNTIDFLLRKEIKIIPKREYLKKNKRKR